MNSISATQFEILMNLDLEDLSKYCRQNKIVNEVCRSNYFWEQKYINDYPNRIFNRNQAKQEYIDIYLKEKKEKAFIKRVIPRIKKYFNSDLDDHLIIDVLHDYGNYENMREAIADLFWDKRVRKYRKPGNSEWLSMVENFARSTNISEKIAARELTKYYGRR